MRYEETQLRARITTTGRADGETERNIYRYYGQPHVWSFRTRTKGGDGHNIGKTLLGSEEIVK
jgi:hypothetical protein